ncbi:DUF1917-domain-containing protein [Xylaria sp. CBS 124048]|nr:DUF1917-domain-containing protein [Xylaria sp. CBS 124048]
MDQPTPMDVDSDFYGDESLVDNLKRKVETYDVRKWWERREASHDQPTACRTPTDIPHLCNPYAGLACAWQLTESNGAFLRRYPPASTVALPDNGWIWASNTYVKSQLKREDTSQQVLGSAGKSSEPDPDTLYKLKRLGEKCLESAAIALAECPEDPNVKVTEKMWSIGEAAKDKILELASKLGVTCGKWMLFYPSSKVDKIWGVIAKATVTDKLGIAATMGPCDGLLMPNHKPSNPSGEARSEYDEEPEMVPTEPAHIVCVYTANIDDFDDITRVARKLEDLEVVLDTIFYKPDVFTYLGISSGNPWCIKTSTHRWMLVTPRRPTSSLGG